MDGVEKVLTIVVLFFLLGITTVVDAQEAVPKAVADGTGLLVGSEAISVAEPIRPVASDVNFRHFCTVEQASETQFDPCIKRREWTKAFAAKKFPIAEIDTESYHRPAVRPADPRLDDSFRWSAAFRQSLVFLAVQHGYAMTQPKTRRALKGPFFKDYVESVKSLNGWSDGGRFFTNYVADPMQGSFMGFIQVQNDPRGAGQTFGRSGAYWKSRMKALAWSAAWSTQFEIGPISQASIGNVGAHGKQTYVDVVMTPLGGIGLLIVEDMLDRFVIKTVEARSGNYFLRIFFRTLLNPTRSVANMIRLKTPWHRDSGLRL